MSIQHERPGVYSSYEASTLISGGRALRAIGVVAKASTGTVGEAVLVTNYADALAHFSGDATKVGLTSLVELLFSNGASSVWAVRVADAATVDDYRQALESLAQVDIQLLVCDSVALEVHQAVKAAVETASSGRYERIGVVGCGAKSVQEQVAHAQSLNSERMVLVGGDVYAADGAVRSGCVAAAAMAGLIAANRDPALPLHGVAVQGLYGVVQALSDGDIDTLVQGGVVALETIQGETSMVRGVTTRTKTGEALDSTWRELSTILIVDDVIPSLRNSLRAKFTRSKNTVRNRSAIRSQVVLELEKKKTAEIITEYGAVTATAHESNPGVCLVEFSFAVAHGLHQIYLTAHISV